MLPPSFFSTYKKYKHDTNIVASWLVAAAQERGYTAQLTKPAQGPSGRPKGKARAQAQGKATDIKNVLAVRDFVPLAEFIANTPAAEAGGDAGIPSFIGTALDRVIRVRKAFSLRLTDLKQNLSARADATHAHFVGVLEKVRDVLIKPGESSTAGDAADTDADNDSAKKTDDPSYNLFDALRLYEPSEKFLNAPDATPAPTFTVNYKVEDNYESEEESRSECLFAFVALLKDLFGLRDEISKLWAEHRAGNLDLAAAAVGTNMALGLARSIEEEMEPLLKKHGGALDLLPLIYDPVCKAQGEDPHERKRPKDDMNFAVYELGSTFMYNVLSLLQAILNAAPYSARDIPSYNGKFGWYNPDHSEEGIKNLRTRWAQEKAALLEVSSDYALLFELKGLPVIDQFGHGLKIMFETQYIPLWLCFAAQNYLDTLHFFGAGVKATHIEFERFNRLAGEQLDIAIKAAPASNKAVVAELEDMRKMVNIKTRGIDIFTATRKAISYDFGRPARPSGFFKHNPIYCGLWIHYTRTMFHQKGVAYAAKPGAVMHLVQLYKAMQQESPSGPASEWSDLDRLLEMQGDGAFFVGSEPPTSLEAHFKNYCMSRNISPANWLAPDNRRKGKGGTVPVTQSKAGTRKLKFKGPMSLWCASRMERGKTGEPERKVWDTAFVQRLLEMSGFEVEQNLPAPQLVHHAARAVQAEVPEIIFSYYVLHQTAESLFKQLEQHADELGLPKIPGSIKAKVKVDTADFAGLIFATARQVEGVLTKVEAVVDDFFEVQSAKYGVPAKCMSQELTIKSAL